MLRVRAAVSSNVFILLITVLFTTVLSGTNEKGVAGKIGHKKDTADTTQPPKHQVRVYYFYFLPRCYACEMIETLTEAAVKEKFADEVRKGVVTYRAIDIGKKENRHYGKDYRLLTKSVIISEVIDGKQKRWKNCDRIWFLYENEERFIDYITREINRYLK